MNWRIYGTLIQKSPSGQRVSLHASGRLPPSRSSAYDGRVWGPGPTGSPSPTLFHILASGDGVRCVVSAVLTWTRPVRARGLWLTNTLIIPESPHIHCIFSRCKWTITIMFLLKVIEPSLGPNNNHCPIKRPSLRAPCWCDTAWLSDRKMLLVMTLSCF